MRMSNCLYQGLSVAVRAYVIVKVMGLSQFPPRFSHPSYEHVTEEGKPLGTTIATVTAASEDTGEPQLNHNTGGSTSDD